MKLYILFLAIIIAFAFAQTNPEDATKDGEKPVAPGRATPPEPITQANSEDLLELLQGGNSDVYVVVFYVDETAKGEVIDLINTNVTEAHPWVRVTEVDLTKVNEYNKLLRVLGMEGEPKRGHSEPQVLVMSKGEGFVIRGPSIVEGILKRIERVEEGTLNKQGVAGRSGGEGYSFGG